PSHKLNRPTILQENSFLPIHGPYRLHKLIQLRKQCRRIISLVPEKMLQPAKLLLRSLHLMRSMQNPLTTPDHAEQLADLKKSILPILTRYSNTTRQRSPTSTSNTEPIIQHL